MAEYQVSFEIFEGPLDLLLYLVRRQEVDIYEVNLTRLAGDFIEYVEMLKVLDLDIAGEFIVMAASLIYIKSKELLPIDQQVVDEEDDDDLDPRWELIRQLVEYKKFKDASRHLQALERAEENIFPREPGKLDFPRVLEMPSGQQATVDDLVKVLQIILERFEQRLERVSEIVQDPFTVSDKIQFILRRLECVDFLLFTHLFEGVSTRSEIAATFLALLELTKQKRIALMQWRHFSDIRVEKSLEEWDSATAEETELTFE